MLPRRTVERGRLCWASQTSALVWSSTPPSARTALQRNTSRFLSARPAQGGPALQGNASSFLSGARTTPGGPAHGDETTSRSLSLREMPSGVIGRGISSSKATMMQNVAEHCKMWECCRATRWQSWLCLGGFKRVVQSVAELIAWACLLQCGETVVVHMEGKISEEYHSTSEILDFNLTILELSSTFIQPTPAQHARFCDQIVERRTVRVTGCSHVGGSKKPVANVQDLFERTQQCSGSFYA